MFPLHALISAVTGDEKDKEDEEEKKVEELEGFLARYLQEKEANRNRFLEKARGKLFKCSCLLVVSCPMHASRMT